MDIEELENSIQVGSIDGMMGSSIDEGPSKSVPH